MNSEPSIQVRDLRVVRGGRLVLPGVSLDVRPGLVTGLLGPSGSGKTTLMRSIVGVQVVESGEVTVLGRPAGSPKNRTLVGYVTQAPSVYGDLTVRENLSYFARVLHAPLASVDGRETSRERTAALSSIRGAPTQCTKLRSPLGSISTAVVLVAPPGYVTSAEVSIPSAT